MQDLSYVACGALRRRRSRMRELVCGRWDSETDRRNAEYRTRNSEFTISWTSQFVIPRSEIFIQTRDLFCHLNVADFLDTRHSTLDTRPSTLPFPSLTTDH
jgi:hypothetical protein